MKTSLESIIKKIPEIESKQWKDITHKNTTGGGWDPTVTTAKHAYLHEADDYTIIVQKTEVKSSGPYGIVGAPTKSDIKDSYCIKIFASIDLTIHENAENIYNTITQKKETQNNHLIKKYLDKP